MRSKRICLLFLLLGVLLVSFGCARDEGDWFAPFGAGFSARIKGEWNGVAFEGTLQASAPGAQGEREMTLSFYAPSSLCGTEIFCGTDGSVTLCVQGFSVPVAGRAAQGYHSLFSLFSPTGGVREVVHEDGVTRVSGESFSLSFAADGTPLSLESSTVSVQILEWRSTENF